MSNNQDGEYNIIEEGASQVDLMRLEKERMRKFKINKEMLDALAEMTNISMGAASISLSSILGRRVTITSPSVQIVEEADVNFKADNQVAFSVKYEQGLDSVNYLTLDISTFRKIAVIMMGGDPSEVQDNLTLESIDEIEISAVQEAMNQMMGRSATAMSEIFKEQVTISPATVIDTYYDLKQTNEGAFFKASFEFQIGDDIVSNLVQYVPIEHARVIAGDLLGFKVQRNKTKEEMNEMLNRFEKDAVGEMANISFGTASTLLSQVLNQKVSITAPAIDIVNSAMLRENEEYPCVVLNVDYVEGIHSENILIIKKYVAASIANLMLGGNGIVDESVEIGTMEISAVQEVMNQMMGNSATAMSEIFKKIIDISPPRVRLVEKADEMNEAMGVELEEESYFVRITFDLHIGELLSSKLVQVIDIVEAKEMASELLRLMEFESDSQVEGEPYDSSGDGTKDNIELAANQTHNHHAVNELVRNAKVKLEVVFGNTTKTLHEILSMGNGEVVKLMEDIDEPLKIYANNIFVGEGIIMNIDGHFGVKIVSLVE